MNRRRALQTLLIAIAPARGLAAMPSVSTLLGSGQPGYSNQQVNNPYGLLIGPDRALYFCDLDNQRIRRFDFKTRTTKTIAGNGGEADSGDGGPAAAAPVHMPDEIQIDVRGHLYIAHG